MFSFLPLEGSSCLSFVACGRTERRSKGTSTSSILKSLKQGYTTNQGRYFTLAFALSGGHFHIDTVREDYFGDDGAPSSTVNAKAFRDAIKPLYGIRATTLFSATFGVPRDRLPKLIQGQMVKAKSGDVSIEGCAGRLRVSGAPFHSMNWWLRDENEIGLEIEMYYMQTFDDNYLTDPYSLIASGFQALALHGRMADEKHQQISKD